MTPIALTFHGSGLYIPIWKEVMAINGCVNCGKVTHYPNLMTGVRLQVYNELGQIWCVGCLWGTIFMITGLFTRPHETMGRPADTGSVIAYSYFLVPSR
jgi:hypothetical protein